MCHQSLLPASDDEDIFASIDLSAISDPFPKLIHLDCNRDTSNYNDWVADKCFTNIFPFDETCLYDPGLLSNLFLVSRQLIAELKLLGQDDREKRLSVTNLLHFVYNELSDLEVDKDLQMIQSLLENKKFVPSAQDGKHYIHGYFEWRLLLALIAVKKGGAVSHLKDLSIELVAYSVTRTGVGCRFLSLQVNYLAKDHPLYSRTLISRTSRHSLASALNRCGVSFSQ